MLSFLNFVFLVYFEPVLHIIQHTRALTSTLTNMQWCGAVKLFCILIYIIYKFLNTHTDNIPPPNYYVLSLSRTKLMFNPKPRLYFCFFSTFGDNLFLIYFDPVGLFPGKVLIFMCYPVQSDGVRVVVSHKVGQLFPHHTSTRVTA